MKPLPKDMYLAAYVSHNKKSLEQMQVSIPEELKN